MPIAVDVALLLPPDVNRLAVNLNRQLDGGRAGGLTLDETHLPHITLVQLFADEERLGDLLSQVVRAAERFGPLDLTVRGMDDASETAMLVFEDNLALQDLHAAMLEIAHRFETEGDAAAFHARAGELPARERDVEWVSSYSREHSLDNFLPHVTVGHGKGASPVEPFRFRADRLAACHLGRHCTCRVVLREHRL